MVLHGAGQVLGQQHLSHVSSCLASSTANVWTRPPPLPTLGLQFASTTCVTEAVIDGSSVAGISTANCGDGSYSNAAFSGCKPW